MPGGYWFVRLRSILLACTVGVGAFFAVADPASALEIGPISLPHKVTVAVPPKVIVGPVVVETPTVLPKVLPKASVETSPENGIGLDVSVPPALGQVLPGLPNSVRVSVGPDGVAVAAPVSQLPSVSVLDPVAASTPRPGSPDPTPHSSASANARSAADSSSVTKSAGSDAVASPTRAHNGRVAPTTPTEDTSGAVNASLQVEQADSSWNLLRAVVSSHALWLALFGIALVASWIVRGLLRDALMRSRVVKPV
jgi:hypothetical protein